MRPVFLPIRASLLFLLVRISLNMFGMFASSFPNRIQLRLYNGMRCSFCCSFGACYFLNMSSTYPRYGLLPLPFFVSCCKVIDGYAASFMRRYFSSRQPNLLLPASSRHLRESFELCPDFSLYRLSM